MHAHLEIVMPSTEDIEAQVAEIMARFDENDTGKDASPSYTFFDWYAIGGRWSGSKVMDAISQERIHNFYELLTARAVTVSSMQMGKQTLKPESQIEMVDALWREHFPDTQMQQCPLFDHYKGNAGDVMKLADIPAGARCERLIIAGPGYETEKNRAQYMVSQSIWNGVSYVKTWWDGTIKSAIADFIDESKNCNPEWVAEHIPGDDWLVVTIDYHD